MKIYASNQTGNWPEMSGNARIGFLLRHLRIFQFRIYLCEKFKCVLIETFKRTKKFTKLFYFFNISVKWI